MDLDKLKRDIIIVLRGIGKVLNKIALPIVLIIVLICAFCYYLNIDDGVYKKGDMSNAPYAVSTYTNSISIDENGQAFASMTAQELWDKMKENDNRGLYYLDTPEQLLKLMNAELVTQFLDTRKNPDEPIDWDKMNDINSRSVQGIVKLKRADASGNTFTMTYVDQETFQDYIDKYNSTGSEEDKNVALSHFTLESITASAYDNMTATEIKKGDVINIPKGLGSVHTYMGWQKITSTTSTQYKLREKAGMKFDSEGFGKINGRYVIACTTTYGTVGDYVDFYQEDGTIIPCIIGDIKNQNDSGCNKWGHNNGQCIIEFVVNKDTWYNTNHPNPGTSSCHPEWHKNLTKAVNGGSYFKDPNFGQENVKEENTVNEVKDSEAMKWPTDSTRITSEFGKRSAPTKGASTNHKGVDIGVAEGTNVYACEAGKVITASYSESAGNWVVIDHGNGYVSKYMHNRELKVSVGDKVEKGQVIALSGNTGHSTGPHLHFQIEYQGNAIDPMSLKYDNGQGSGTGGIGNDAENTDSSKTQCYAKVATWNESTDKIESNDPDVESSEKTTYNMTTTNINYKDFLNCYTMPFDYLWAFMVISESQDMVLELADLVYNSEIEITVHDNLTVTTDVVENTYTKKKKTDTSATVSVNYGTDANNLSGSDSDSGNWTDVESKDYKVTHTVINKTNTLDISLTKANVWIVDYNQEYTYSKPTSTSTSNTEELEDDNYPSTPDSTSNNDTYGHAKNLLSSLKNKYTPTYDYVNGKVDSIEEKIYNATVNKNKKTTNTVEKEEYISSPGNTKEKTDPDSDEPNFVTILGKNEYRNAKNNIVEVSSWLFEILEENDSTKDMVDLTKYLLYKVTGNKGYGVTEYDFSEFNSSFNSVGDSQGGLSADGSKIVEIAKSKLGCPYSLGAKGPNTFDCSGFVYWVYKQVGISVPGSTEEYQSYIGSKKEISWSDAKPGDILIITADERGTTYGHAGIYLGNDEYIHAPQSGDVVKISKGAKSKFEHVFRFYTESIEGTATKGDGYDKEITLNNKTYREYKQSRGSYMTVGFGVTKCSVHGAPHVHNNGCGPTSVAIIASGYGKNYNPGDIATLMGGVRAQSSGATISNVLNKIGISAHAVYTPSKQALQKQLSSGKPFVVSVNNGMGNLFTKAGHLMAILAINDKNEVYVSNPNPSTKQGWVPLDTLYECCKSKYAIFIDKK